MKTSVWLPLFLALVSQHEAHEGRPGPRSQIGSRAGIRCRSRLDFGGVQNRFEAVYVFPDRARWTFESLDGSERALFFRSGAEVYQVAGGPSQPIEGASRATLLVQMELRRAVLLWPLGFEWKEDGEERRAPVFASSCCRSDPLGELVASGPDPDRPERIEARDGEGRSLETIELLAWRDQAGRTEPTSLRVSGAGGRFEEAIDTIDSAFRYLDQAFLPGDRRLRGDAAPGPGVLAADLVATTFLAHDLTPGLDWDRARAEAEQALEMVRARLGADGPALDPLPTFELDARARPIRCLVRLATSVVPPPEGFRSQGERSGFLLSLGSASELTVELVERMLLLAPPDARPATPYVRLHSGRVELVLPLEAR